MHPVINQNLQDKIK